MDTFLFPITIFEDENGIGRTIIACLFLLPEPEGIIMSEKRAVKTSREFWFRLIYGSWLVLATFGGFKLPLFIMLSLIKTYDEALAWSVITVFAISAYLVFRKIKLQLNDVWNFEYPLLSWGAALTVFWSFLLGFLMVAGYIALCGLASPFVLVAKWLDGFLPWS